MDIRWVSVKRKKNLVHKNNKLFVSSNQIDLKHKNQLNNTANMVEIGIELKEFYPSVEWDILGVPAERHEK